MTRTGPLTEFSPLTPDALRHLLDAELSLQARMAHVALLIVAALGTAGLLSLWLTEAAHGIGHRGLVLPHDQVGGVGRHLAVGHPRRPAPSSAAVSEPRA